MCSHDMLIVTPPRELSDEAASELLELLHQLAVQFENHYAEQIRRYREPGNQPHHCDPCPDQDPPF